MPRPVWPTSLPLPRLQGYRRQIVEPFVSFKADKPLADKRRRVTTVRAYEQDLTFRMTKTEWETLDAFYHDASPYGCGGGVERFAITDALTGAPYEAEFVEGGAPVLSEGGQVPKHDVSFRLRIWPE